MYENLFFLLLLRQQFRITIEFEGKDMTHGERKRMKEGMKNRYKMRFIFFNNIIRDTNRSKRTYKKEKIKKKNQIEIFCNFPSVECISGK